MMRDLLSNANALPENLAMSCAVAVRWAAAMPPRPPPHPLREKPSDFLIITNSLDDDSIFQLNLSITLYITMIAIVVG